MPAMVRWPGHIKAGEVSNELFSGLDWFPTLVAAAGNPDIKESLVKGTGHWRYGAQSTPRRLQPVALPHRPAAAWRSRRVLLLQRRRRPSRDAMGCAATRSNHQDGMEAGVLRTAASGQFDIWANPFTCLRIPRMFNLRMDPYEHAQISGDNYDSWRADKRILVFDGTRRAEDSCKPSLNIRPASRLRASPLIRSKTV